VKDAGKADVKQLLELIRSGRAYVEAKHFANPVHGSVPPALSHVCQKGLSLRAEDRFQSARELEAALQLWLEGRAPVVCPRTAIQSALCGYNRFLDRHLLLGPMLTGIAAIVVLASLIYTVASLLS
jgi:hypothetical protein